jgi:hypothetical protein
MKFYNSDNVKKLIIFLYWIKFPPKLQDFNYDVLDENSAQYRWLITKPKDEVQ